MGKRFTEYSQFDLSQVNKDVLKKWDENQVFAKSMTERWLPFVCVFRRTSLG